MKTANEFFDEFRAMCQVKGNQKRIEIARLLNELEIDLVTVDNPGVAIPIIRVQIFRRLAQEKGLVPGTKVTVTGKRGTFVVVGTDSFGLVRLTRLRVTVSPNSVNKVD